MQKNSAQDEPRSIMGKLIAQMTSLEPGARHEEEKIAKNVGAVALEAGTDTVCFSSPLLTNPQ